MRETNDQFAKRLTDMIPKPMTEDEFWENERRQDELTFRWFVVFPFVVIISTLLYLLVLSVGDPTLLSA